MLSPFNSLKQERARVCGLHNTTCLLKYVETAAVVSVQILKTCIPIHTHTCIDTRPQSHSLPPPLLLLFFPLFVLSRREDRMFGFFPLNKNNLLSDVGSLVVVTGPKLKCGLIKACVCVRVWTWALDTDPPNKLTVRD